MPKGKTSDYDDIDVKLLKLAALFISHSIAYICNMSL